MWLIRLRRIAFLDLGQIGIGFENKHFEIGSRYLFLRRFYFKRYLSKKEL